MKDAAQIEQGGKVIAIGLKLGNSLLCFITYRLALENFVNIAPLRPEVNNTLKHLHCRLVSDELIWCPTKRLQDCVNICFQVPWEQREGRPDLQFVCIDLPRALEGRLINTL